MKRVTLSLLDAAAAAPQASSVSAAASVATALRRVPGQGMLRLTSRNRGRNMDHVDAAAAAITAVAVQGEWWRQCSKIIKAEL